MPTHGTPHGNPEDARSRLEPPSAAAAEREIALIDGTGTIPAGELAGVAAALTEQARSHFAGFWLIGAHVRACRAPPLGAWILFLTDDVPGTGSGFHSHAYGRPFALVDMHAGRWTVTASHELLEMLADPWRDRLQIAPPPPGWAGSSALVHYLVQVCDPCQRSVYEIRGIEVSDFLVPRFYDGPGVSDGQPEGSCAVSYGGSLTHARHVGEGGYLAFIDPARGHVWQRHVHDGETSDVDWGPSDHAFGVAARGGPAEQRK